MFVLLDCCFICFYVCKYNILISYCKLFSHITLLNCAKNTTNYNTLISQSTKKHIKAIVR
ncbi:hypothetical protein HMPREF9144_2680 [Prevotella pallens ATCC 700821]|uniref:Uncharacterized protein n=1 Tax=Prevotella pallens ATCC 700821 TaxID=997353 RepID=F9DLY8_9BACT|nr:hypothetical protein HMPREF9144_2680 [Prevotella pallens ATCC 700821]